MNESLVSYMNSTCNCASHSHRYATNEEIDKYSLKNTKTCVFCVSQLFPEQDNWTCGSYTINIHHSLHLQNKIIFYILCSVDKSPYFLPVELIEYIFSICSYSEEKECDINKISYDLIDHSKKCRVCSYKILDIITRYACPNHMLPRKPLNNIDNNIINYYD